MQKISLNIHPDIQIRVATIGKEQQPIILVDKFVEDAERLINYAADHTDSKPSEGFYPGVRAMSPPEYMSLIRGAMGDVIASTFQTRLFHFHDEASFFSLVSVPPDQLQALQRIPHIDGYNPNDIAFLHYLCDEKYGGTSFYRHKTSTYEYVDQQRFAPYIEMLEAEINTRGLPHPPQYMNGDNDLFERIASVEAKFNRLIIYRGTSLHSGDIPPDYNFDLNPRTGRLTITSFLYSTV